jgi:hypothetical protein
MVYVDDNPMWGDLNKATSGYNTGDRIIAPEEVLNPGAKKSNPSQTTWMMVPALASL